MRVLGVACTSLLVAQAMRQGQRSEKAQFDSPPVTLFTYGAPAVSFPELKAKDGISCMQGSRMFNTQSTYWSNWIDGVPVLAQAVPFDHYGYEAQFFQPSIQAVSLKSDEKKSQVYDCKSVQWREDHHGAMPSVALHSSARYEKLGKQMGDSIGDRLMAAASYIALKESYENDPAVVTQRIKDKAGWEMLAHIDLAGEIDGQQVTTLLRDPSTEACWLTFEGTNDMEDWLSNANVDNVPFCGLKSGLLDKDNKSVPYAFHAGFVEKVRETTLSKSWAAKFPPLLRQCKAVNVVGHSLGGAMATLVTACMEGGDPADNDYHAIWGQ